MHFIRYIVTMFNVLYCISYENIGSILNVKLLTEVVQVVNIRSFEARKKIFFYSPRDSPFIRNYYSLIKSCLRNWI